MCPTEDSTAIANKTGEAMNWTRRGIQGDIGKSKILDLTILFHNLNYLVNISSTKILYVIIFCIYSPSTMYSRRSFS